MSQKKTQTFLIIAVLSVLGAVAFYSIREYRASQIEQEGLIVCNSEGICEKSMHIHSELYVSICGKPHDLPKEKGSITNVHTHKEVNLLHFHERLKIDQNGDILDPTPLTLANATQNLLGFKLTNSCVGNFCNGNMCPTGKRGTLSLKVNNHKLNEIPEYIWKDGDKIELTFDEN